MPVIPISTTYKYNNSYKAPSYQEQNLTKIFDANQAAIYSSPDIYGDQTPNSDPIVRQPYVWVAPGGSNLNNLLNAIDSNALPVGSSITDEQRIGKFLLSGKGLLFLATQAILQGQNAFNETSLYDPLSVPLTIAANAAGGILSTATRFVPIDALLPGPAGTLIAALPSTNTDEASGLQRARTAAAGYSSFTQKYTGTVSSQGILAQLAASIAPNLAPLPTQPGTYKVADTVIFDTMVSNLSKPTSIFSYYTADGVLTNAVQTSTPNSPTTPSIGTGGDIVSDIETIWSNWSNGQSTTIGANIIPGLSATTGINASAAQINQQLQSILSGISTSPVSAIASYLPINSFVSQISSVGSSDIGLSSPLAGFQKAFTSANPLQSLEGAAGKMFPSFAGGLANSGIDKYNSLIPLSFPNIGNVNSLFNTPLTDQTGGNTTALNDLIQFYFSDIINGVFLPFRATLTDIALENSAKWTPITYIGRADRLFVYEGFEKNLSFSFKVYANSPEELLPMWKRINYLVSMTSPAKYTANAAAQADFIVPPFMKITIGDLFKNQPVVMNSVGISIPEEASWELTADGGAFSFLGGLITRSATVAQVPMLVEISVQCSLLEKNAPAAGNRQFGDITTGGAFSQGMGTGNGTTVNGVVLT